jgi:hypothetical protein
MIVRVTEPGRPAFQLRKGEEGISVFDLDAVSPALIETEILDCFRAGSLLVSRSLLEIEGKGLAVIPVLGAEPLPARRRMAHAEIRSVPGMSRAEFKQALKELE